MTSRPSSDEELYGGPALPDSGSRRILHQAQDEIDIRVRERTAELSEAHRRTTAVLDAINEGFVILDRDWRFVFVNAAAERFILKSREELLGKSHWEAFPEASHRQFGVEYRRAVAEGIPVHFEEFYPEPLNRWFEVRAYPSPEGLSIFFGDITERKRVTQALRESEERYRSLFNSMSEGFALHEIVCDGRGEPCDYRFLEINPAFEALTGLKREDVVGRLKSEVLPDDDPRWVGAYGAVALTGESTHFDLYSPALRRHYEVFAYRSAPRQFAVVFLDITEHRRTEEELRAALTKYSGTVRDLPAGHHRVGRPWQHPGNE